VTAERNVLLDKLAILQPVNVKAVEMNVPPDRLAILQPVNVKAVEMNVLPVPFVTP